MSETSGTIKTDSIGSETSQVRRLVDREQQLVSAMAKAFESLDFTRICVPSDTVGVAYAIHQMSPKAAEINRQIDRLRLAKEVAGDLALDKAGTSIGDSISFLQNLCVGPIPIPVASWSPDSGPSLFFEGDEFYGDLEISDGVIEYFIKSGDRGNQVEIFDTEEIEEGRIPPRLLTILFSKFARTTNEVR